MDKYINYEQVTIKKLVCHHPKVWRIWETGALSGIANNDKMSRTVHIILNDKQTRNDFEDDGDGQAITDAENWLKTI